MQPLWLTQTKLQPPRLREDIIPRPRLSHLLHQAIATHILTLISAPAGYGKTTLVAEWRSHLAGEQGSRGAGGQGSKPRPELVEGGAEEKGSRGAGEQRGRGEKDSPLHPITPAPRQVCWLSLDQEDNSPTIFISGLAAALQTLNPTCGASVQSLLSSQAAPNLEARRLIGILINDILETLPEPFVIVLDDLHAITESSIYEALDYLLEHIPWQMRLVVTTRMDPPLSLARLRARGLLAEFHLPDLRFSLKEITALLNDQLQFNLSAAELQVLEASTEGWAAGLRLLAASFDRIPLAERDRVITSLAGSNRYIFDFLAEEVLNRQAPAVRSFLLESAILTELTPALCRAVTGRHDAAAILEDLYRRNLFLLAVDGPSPMPATTYRYHALFATFLRQQLARERSTQELAALHRRAAEAETVPARAIDHYFAASDWLEAGRMIEQIAETTFSQGLLDRLSSWIQAVPLEIRERRPWLLYFLGVCVWGQGHFDQAQNLLNQALTGFEAGGDDWGRGASLIQLSIIYQSAGNFAPAADLARRALGCPVSVRSHTQLYLAFAWLALGQGDLGQAQTNLEAALSLAETSGDPGAMQILAMQLRSPFHCLPNGIALMERLHRLIEQRVPDQLHPWRANLAALEAYLYLWRGQINPALEAAERAWSASDALGGLSWLMVDIGLLLSHLYFLQGDLARAESAFHQFAGLANDYPAWRAALLFPQALNLWSQGRLDEAGQLYVQMHPSGLAYEWPVGLALRPMLRGLLEIADRNYTRAEQTLRQAQQLQQNIPVSTRFNARLLLAYLYDRWGRHESALHELAPVLAEYQQAALPGLLIGHGAVIVRPLLELALKHGLQAEFVRAMLEILQMTGAPNSLHVPTTGAILTPREVEVLRLLVTGASNKVIAAQLVVSLPTVKTHISRILGKLSVETRSAAAARARELHLV